MLATAYYHLDLTGKILQAIPLLKVGKEQGPQVLVLEELAVLRLVRPIAGALPALLVEKLAIATPPNHRYYSKLTPSQ